LLLRWEERNGPAIEKTPTSDGFGNIVVRRSIVGQLGGKLDYTWKPERVPCLYLNTDGTSLKLTVAVLIEGGVPVIFYSGLALPAALRERYPSVCFYKKPTPPVQLLNELVALMRK
jgi:hypothetical protein